MYHPAASKLGVDRKAVSAISRPRPAIKSGKALKCYTLNVRSMHDSMAVASQADKLWPSLSAQRACQRASAFCLALIVVLKSV